MATKIQVDLIIGNAQAAQTLKETKNSIKELQSAALQLEQGSVGFNKLIAKAGELKDRLNDVQDTTKVLAGNNVENLTNSFAKLSSAAIGGFQAIAGAQAVFGSQSKDVAATLVQLQGLMSLSQGIKEVANIGQAYKDFNSVITNVIGKIATKTVVTSADAVATEGAAVATVGFNAALLANPITAILVGLAALAAAFAYVSAQQEKARESALDYQILLKELAKSADETATRIDELRKKATLS